MRPVRIAKEVQDAYIPVMDEAIQYEWADRKIRIEGTPVEKEPVLVQRFHIDTNHHMNNGNIFLWQRNICRRILRQRVSAWNTKGCSHREHVIPGGL